MKINLWVHETENGFIFTCHINPEGMMNVGGGDRRICVEGKDLTAIDRLSDEVGLILQELRAQIFKSIKADILKPERRPSCLHSRF